MQMQADESYLEVRRAAGFQLKDVGSVLLAFARYSQEHHLAHVNARIAVEWAALAPSPRQRYFRLMAVRYFARYLQAEDHRHEIPPEGVFSSHLERRPPFIYSQQDINHLIEGAIRLAPKGCPYTYSTLLALLSVTGLRISEALALRLGDLTEDGLIIRKTKFRKSRLVPLHPTAVVGLESYLLHRFRVAAETDHLFVSSVGRPLLAKVVQRNFAILRESIGLKAAPGQRPPRIHDLRHSLAVRILEQCTGGRDRITEDMLALSTYLGHSKVAHTYWYFEATPQLLAQISRDCEAFVRGDPR